MAQKPRPSGTIRTPNYPRLSSLAIAAALSACNGEVRIPMDGDGVHPTPGGGASNTIMGSTAGVIVLPYGGQGGATSSTDATTAEATGGIGNPAGDIALPFGGTTSIAPEATGGAPEIGDPHGAAPQSFGGSGTTTPIAAGGVSPQSTTATGGVSPQTTATTGGRPGTGGSPIATGGGTSVQVFKTTSTLSSGTSPGAGRPD